MIQHAGSKKPPNRKKQGKTGKKGLAPRDPHLRSLAAELAGLKQPEAARSRELLPASHGKVFERLQSSGVSVMFCALPFCLWVLGSFIEEVLLEYRLSGYI